MTTTNAQHITRWRGTRRDCRDPRMHPPHKTGTYDAGRHGPCDLFCAGSAVVLEHIADPGYPGEYTLALPDDASRQPRGEEA